MSQNQVTDGHTSSANKGRVSASKVLSPLSSERFSHTFVRYIAASDEKSQMIESYARLFNEHHCFDRWHAQDEIRIVDLACGNGQTTALLLELLATKLPLQRVRLYGRDADNGIVKEYSAGLSKRFPDIQLTVTEGDALKNPPSELTNQADLTLVSHALYHVSPYEVETVLDNIASTLSASGIALISLLGDQSDFNKIQNQFVMQFERAGQSHLTVDTPTFGMIAEAARNMRFDRGCTIIPYPARLVLPISMENLPEFQAWCAAPDLRHPLASDFETTTDLLEFMLHRDWAGLVQSGSLREYIDLIGRLVAKNDPDPRGFATLDLSGATLVLGVSPGISSA